MRTFDHLIAELQQVNCEDQHTIKNLLARITQMERELKTPRQHDARIAGQGRIIGEQAEEIRQLKAQNKRQAASLRAAKEALK